MKNVSLQAKIVACAIGALFCGALFTQASRHERVTARWADDGLMRKARQGACSAILADGRVLIAGGNSEGAAIADAEIYDGSGAFQAAASMQTARAQHACATLPDSRILAAGGRTTGDALTNLAEIYDPARDQWSPAGFMTASRAGATATVLPGGSILIAGGSNGSQELATSDLFDPKTGEVTPAGNMGAARRNHLAFLLPQGSITKVNSTNFIQGPPCETRLACRTLITPLFIHLLGEYFD